MSTLAVILSTMAPVVIVPMIGFFLARAGRPFDNKTVSLLIAHIGSPALIFENLAKTDRGAGELLGVAGATLAALATNLLVGVVLLKVAKLSLRSYLPSLAFPNSGNLGLPLALYATGAEGLTYAIVIFATGAIANLTAGQAIAAGRARFSTVLRSPIIPAVVLGLAFSFGGLHLPLWAQHTLDLIASLTIPLMLLMLGTACATLRITVLRRSLVIALLRLVLGILAGFVFSGLFAFEGALRVVFILQCSMPVAVYNYLWAQMYDNDADTVASIVVLSTLLSLFTTLGLLAVLMV